MWLGINISIGLLGLAMVFLCCCVNRKVGEGAT
jgi:hypothetical protein